MGRLTGGQTETLPDAPFAFDKTLEAVRMLAGQLNGLEAPRMTKVKIPSGGGITWEIPNGTSDPETTKAIEGVVISHRAVNVYWDKPREESSHEPPACASDDGISGWDADGMEYACASCPRNRLGSAEFGNLKGKACKNTARLTVLREGDAMPIEVIIPAMSLPNLSAYIRQLSENRMTMQDVVTKITLGKAANAKGDQYSKAQFQALGKVDAESMKSLRLAVAPMLMIEGGAAAARER